MNENLKKLINIILVILFTILYVLLITSLITNTRLIFVFVGVWCIIIGVWGNVVGMRLAKPIVISDDYRKENFFVILLGILLTLVGLILYIIYKIKPGDKIALANLRFEFALQ